MTGRLGGGLRRASWRLAVQTGVMLVLLLAAIAASVLLIVSSSQAESAHRLLASATGHVDSVQDAPAGVWLAIADHGQLTVSPGMPAGLPDRDALAAAVGHGPIEENVSIGSHSYTIRTAASQGRVVQAVLDRHENQEELNRLVRALLLTGSGAVLVASLLAVWLARRVMNPMAQALNLQRRFVTDASHELRTPLTLLSMRAQLLRRRLAASEATQPSVDVGTEVEALVADSRSLATILEDLLLAADSRESERLRVDVVALATDAIQSFTASGAHPEITIRLSGDIGPLEISASPSALRRMLTALLDNAVRFARSRVDVAVTSDANMATITITVSDDGPGFAGDLAGRAFERFATATRARPAEGGEQRHYGLGLALVADVAAQHGGTVQVVPSASGAVIVVRMPTGRQPGRRPRRT